MPLTSPSYASGGNAPVPRQVLTFVRLAMPALGRGRLLDAARLQLTQYMPAGPFGFICRAQTHGYVIAWAWVIVGSAGSPRRRGNWPESASDDTTQGLRLLRRSAGFEAQQWAGGELLHSRWFATLPDDAEWQRFARGCGVDPQGYPLPEPTVARQLRRPSRAWLAGDNLPAADPWQGWHWQVGLLLLGCIAAAALGLHLQAREQLRIDTLRLTALRSSREASLQSRMRFEQASAELGTLSALAPKLSQLELLDRVVASGIFAPIKKSEPTKPAPVAPSLAPGMPPGAGLPELALTRLLDWDFRNGQLKITLELPERDMTLLDITRRLEAVPGLGVLRVGQDSAGNTLTLSGTVAEFGPPSGAVR